LFSIGACSARYSITSENEVAMKIFLFIVAIVLIIFGAIWALQGLSIIGGSFMVGQTRWLYIGLLTVVVGIGLLIFARTR
jgi:hypothetical protein